jgi:hypothetical protein
MIENISAGSASECQKIRKEQRGGGWRRGEEEEEERVKNENLNMRD